MEIGLRDIINLAAPSSRAADIDGLPAPAEVRRRQQRLAVLIGQVGLFPMPLALRAQFGVPLTPYFLPKLLSAQRFVEKRGDIGERAKASPAFFSALLRMEPAIASWEEALAQVEATARHGVLLTLRGMSERTDALTARIDERLRAGGAAADRLRIRLARVIKAQGQFEDVVKARKERARRRKEASAQALAAAQAETRLLLGSDRLASAGLLSGTPLPVARVEAPLPADSRPSRRASEPAGRAVLDGGLPGGLNVTPRELTELALEVGALAQGLGVPPLSEEQGEELVLSIDPLVVVVANLYGLLLPEGPGAEVAEELAGLFTSDLGQRAAILSEMVDLYQEAARGLRGARDGHVLVASVGQKGVGRLLKEVRALMDGPSTAETEPVRADAGDLLRVEEQERNERLTLSDKTRKEGAARESAVRAVERQNRFLKTVLAMRNREAVSREELDEALAAYEDIGRGTVLQSGRCGEDG